MAKVQIVSGFLGAGKTTWIKKALAESFKDEKVMLIENEFGDIGIDGGFLQDVGVEITELNSGCICCTLVGDFVTALKQAVKDYAPEVIIIEPSGVGKLSDILKAITEVEEDSDLKIEGSLTIVDAKKAKMYLKNFKEFFEDQIKYADVVVLSHTKDLDDEKIEEVRKIVSDINEQAKIVTTDWDKFDANEVETLLDEADSFRKELLKEVRKMEVHHHEHEHEHHHHDEDECECHHEHKHHHHHENEDCKCHHEHECCEGEEDECECHHEYECCEGEEDDCKCHHEHKRHHHHHHDADEVFDTYGLESAKTYTPEQINDILNTIQKDEELFEHVIRAKGIVPGVDGNWIHFDYVPGEADVHLGSASYTGKICVIGTDLNKEKLKGLFEA